MLPKCYDDINVRMYVFFFLFIYNITLNESILCGKTLWTAQHRFRTRAEDVTLQVIFIVQLYLIIILTRHFVNFFWPYTDKPQIVWFLPREKKSFTVIECIERYCILYIYYLFNLFIHGWVWRTKSAEILPYSVVLMFGFILQWWTRWYEYYYLRHLFFCIIYSSTKRFIYLYVEYTCQALTSDKNKISEKKNSCINVKYNIIRFSFTHQSWYLGIVFLYTL